jgi:DNA-binding NarL/FixJ family response regulator
MSPRALLHPTWGMKREAPGAWVEAEAMNALIRVALGEADFLGREGMTRVLERLVGIQLVATCADLDTLRSEIDRCRPDVVVVDAEMPPDGADGGVRLAVELRLTHPRTGVVVLSRRASPSEATALFADGSFRRGYLLQERVQDPTDIARAIGEVAEGGAASSTSSSRRAARARRPRRSPSSRRASSRSSRSSQKG